MGVGTANKSEEEKINTVRTPTTRLSAEEILYQAEQQTLKLHGTGRALRAVADLTRRSSTSDPDHLQAAKRDDVACLMEVLGETVLQQARSVEHLLVEATRSPKDKD